MGSKKRPCEAGAVRVLQGPADRHAGAGVYAVPDVVAGTPVRAILRRRCAGINRFYVVCRAI